MRVTGGFRPDLPSFFSTRPSTGFCCGRLWRSFFQPGLFLLFPFSAHFRRRFSALQFSPMTGKTTIIDGPPGAVFPAPRASFFRLWKCGKSSTIRPKPPAQAAAGRRGVFHRFHSPYCCYCFIYYTTTVSRGNRAVPPARKNRLPNICGEALTSSGTAPGRAPPGCGTRRRRCRPPRRRASGSPSSAAAASPSAARPSCPRCRCR